MPSRSAIKPLILLIGILLALPAQSLDPKRSFYQYEFDGPAGDINLPAPVVDVVQSAEGFLWLATSRGLAKYDGLELSLYRVSRYPEILSNTPTQLFVDSGNRLFVASERGLSIYENGVFRVLEDSADWAEEIRVMAEDPYGTVWLGSDDGVWQYSNDEIHPLADGTAMRQVRSLLWHDEQMFIGGRGYVFAARESVVRVIALPGAFANSRVREIVAHQGRIWLATRRGMLGLNDALDAAIPDDRFAGMSIDHLLSDVDENLWFANRSSIGRILPDGRIERPDITDYSFGFAPDFTEIFEDDAGIQWHTGESFGLVLMRDSAVRRVSYTEGLKSPNVTAIAARQDGSVFVATDKGISLLAGNVTTEVVAEEFPTNAYIRAMLVDESQILWVGTERGLRTLSLATGMWTVPPPGVDVEVAVNSIVAGVNGRIWIGTENGLFGVADGRVEHIAETTGLRVQALLLDRREQLWVGTEDGVARIDNGVFVDVLTEASDQLQSLNSLVEMPSGHIVSATSDRGIAVYDGETWTRFGEADGIPPEQLIDIEVDTNSNSLWLFTGSGVFRTSVLPVGEDSNESMQVQPIVATSRYRGAHNTYCCRGYNGAAALISDGQIYAATDDGVVVFDQNISTAISSPPKPYIHSVSVADVAWDLTSEQAHLLEPTSNELRVDYSAIQLDRGYQVEFRYRLLGLSNEWVNNGRARSVQFQNLPPGEYSFELQASFQPDQWSPTENGFTFERLPGFAETNAYRVLLWVATVGVALCLIWVRMATTRHRHTRLEAEIKERTWALSELNNELKSANQILRKSSQTDPLTGLVNRRFFETDDGRAPIADELANQGVVMLIDIDFFKRVNDSYGHAAGDEVLCQFASVLRSCMRQSDLVVRWGGEEFVVICRCPNDDAAAMLDRLCSSIRDHAFILSSGKRINIACSIGCIRYPLWADVSLDDRMPILLELADAALYIVKMSGRDGWGLLEGGENPIADPHTRHVGPKIGQYIDKQQLVWTSSRPEMDPSLDDTHTRLRAIRGLPR